MGFVPVVNTVQLELITSFQGSIAETVLHYTKESPWLLDQAGELGASAVSKWNTYMKPLVSSQVILNLIKITDLSSLNGFVLDYSTGLPLQGTNSGSALPANCALVITKRTALRGRSYRGRIYHYGMNTAQVSNSAVLTASLTSILAAWNQFKVLAITDSEGLMTVVSRVSDGVPRLPGIATLVSSLDSDGTLDSQRRRLPGRGA